MTLGWILMTPFLAAIILAIWANKEGSKTESFGCLWIVLTLFLIGLGLLIGGFL